MTYPDTYDIVRGRYCCTIYVSCS